MPSGIESNGMDLDSIFLAYNSPDTPAPATGIKINGADLNTRYENITYGSPTTATGIESNGADLNTFFAAYGSGSEWTASLPQFPVPFTKSPQPYPTGTDTMSVTLAGGPGGSYTYLWSSVPDGAHFIIVSGQGSATIRWYATGVYGEPGDVTVTCKVTAIGGTNVSASTKLTFNVGPPQ